MKADGQIPIEVIGLPSVQNIRSLNRSEAESDDFRLRAVGSG
jgi:hypothetical protein